MKKTYMAPSTEVVKIESTEMLLEISGFSSTVGSQETQGEEALGKDRDINSGFGDLW